DGAELARMARAVTSASSMAVTRHGVEVGAQRVVPTDRAFGDPGGGRAESARRRRSGPGRAAGSRWAPTRRWAGEVSAETGLGGAADAHVWSPTIPSRRSPSNRAIGSMIDQDSAEPGMEKLLEAPAAHWTRIRTFTTLLCRSGSVGNMPETT